MRKPTHNINYARAQIYLQAGKYIFGNRNSPQKQYRTILFGIFIVEFCNNTKRTESEFCIIVVFCNKRCVVRGNVFAPVLPTKNFAAFCNFFTCLTVILERYLAITI